VFLLHDAPVNVEGDDGWEEVFTRYAAATQGIELQGIANLAPIILKAKEVAESRPKILHMLVVLVTNDIMDPKDEALQDQYAAARAATANAILQASEVPLCIVVIGLGDGPWGLMENFNHHLHWRKFDNFVFVKFHDILGPDAPKFPGREFAKQCLCQLPEQLKKLRELGMIAPAGA